MKIILDKVSKRFNRDWLFRNLDYQFETANAYAIVGPNGSGKTTLLKIISGMTPCTEGQVSHTVENKTIDPDQVYRYITIAAPYMDLPEELTLQEFLKFHFGLKPAVNNVSISDIAESVGLSQAFYKPIHTFSSGMKQRVKLALGIFCTTPVLLLDEPTTNLDQSGTSWYLNEIEALSIDKILIISSNQPVEYQFCKHIIDLNHHRTSKKSQL